MSPHRLFLLLLAGSVPVTALTFIKNADEMAGLLSVLGMAGSAILLVLIVTRKYWKNARRVSSC